MVKLNQNQMKLLEILRLAEEKDKEKAWRLAVQRLIALGFKEICERCAGTGEYSYNRMWGRVCFNCQGEGYKVPRLTKKLLAEVQKAVDEGKLDAYIAEVRERILAKKKLGALKKKIETVWEGELSKDYTAESMAVQRGLKKEINPVIFLLQKQNNALHDKFYTAFSQYEVLVNQGKKKEAQALLPFVVKTGEEVLEELVKLHEGYKAIKENKIG